MKHHGGQNWTPIPFLKGSTLHAETHHSDFWGCRPEPVPRPSWPDVCCGARRTATSGNAAMQDFLRSTSNYGPRGVEWKVAFATSGEPLDGSAARQAPHPIQSSRWRRRLKNRSITHTENLRTGTSLTVNAIGRRFDPYRQFGRRRPPER